MLVFTEHNYVAIAIVKGKMLTIAIHASASPPALLASEIDDSASADITTDNSPAIDLLSQNSANEKDIPISSLSRGRSGFGIVSTNSTIFVLGGYDRGDCLDTIEQFNPIEGKWTVLPIPMLSRRGRVSATILDNKIYVCGGSDGQQELNTGEYLDIRKMDKWLPLQDLPTPVTHGGKILLNYFHLKSIYILRY